MEPKIIITGSRITIPAFESKRGNAPETTIDLAPYAGEYIRIWLDADMTYSVDRHKNHYWQVAELRVPHQQYTSVDTGEIDERGVKIERAEKIPIELVKKKIDLWDIEEKPVIEEESIEGEPGEVAL